MTARPRRDEHLDEPEQELPPMADDEEAGDEDTPLDSLIEEQRDDGMSWLDDRVGIDDYDAETMADEIGAQEGDETSWTDESEGDDELEGTEADLDFGEEYGWTDDSDEPEPGTFDDDLDFGDESGPSVLDDGGEEGLDDEDFDLDTSGWKELDDEDGDGTPDLDDEDFGLSTMSYEEELRAGGGALPDAVDEAQLKAAWLGPPGVPATTVAFGGGLLWAAGSGLFLSEERELVAAPASRTLEEAEATSVRVDPAAPKTIFVGTMLAGLLRSNDGGETLGSDNSWAAAAPGCGRPASPSVPVEIAVSRAGGGRLWLRTGRDQLLRSDDRGKTWSLAAPGYRVTALAADAEGTSVAALGTRDGQVVVLFDEAGESLRPRPMPEATSTALLTAPEPCIATSSGVVLVGAEELTDGMLLASSPDEELRVAPGCPRCTALAAVGGDAPFILAGLFFAGRDLGTLLRSNDGGESWVRICDVGRLEHLFDVDLVGHEDISSRIHAIAVNPGAPAQVALATGYGVFVLEMKDI